MKSKSKEPFHSIRIGELEVLIYRHKGPSGYRFTTSFKMHFLAPYGPAMGTSFGEEDLSTLENLVQVADEWIRAQPRSYPGPTTPVGRLAA